jgi:hypothetical protein
MRMDGILLNRHDALLICFSACILLKIPIMRGRGMGMISY